MFVKITGVNNSMRKPVQTSDSSNRLSDELVLDQSWLRQFLSFLFLFFLSFPAQDIFAESGQARLDNRIVQNDYIKYTDLFLACVWTVIITIQPVEC